MAIIGAACGTEPDPGEETQPPTITTLSLTDAKVGEAYAQNLALKDGEAPITWELRSVPPELSWLRIDSTEGTLGGTPSVPVVPASSFAIAVRDAKDRTDLKTFGLVVRGCVEGETSACAASNGTACLIGVQACTGGKLSDCNVGAPSSDVAKCGAGCGSCGEASDQCLDGRCKCGTEAPCSGAAPTCCGGPDASACTDTQTDLDNCGGCGTACDRDRIGVDEQCVGGVCNYACAPGYDRCPRGSTSPACDTYLVEDPQNCGACGTVCPTSVANATVPGDRCDGSKCQFACSGLWGDCNNSIGDGCEKPLADDPNNCGACGNVCPAIVGGSPTCNSGVCGGSCPVTHRLCGTTCVPLTDENNCGSCGNVCPATATNANDMVCSANTCTPVCNSGFGNCTAADGCETSLSNNDNHCGRCGNSCGVDATCNNGRCCYQECDPERKPPCQTICEN